MDNVSSKKKEGGAKILYFMQFLVLKQGRLCQIYLKLWLGLTTVVRFFSCSCLLFKLFRNILNKTENVNIVLFILSKDGIRIGLVS